MPEQILWFCILCMLGIIVDRPTDYSEYPTSNLLFSYQNYFSHNVKKRCPHCPKLCGVWCVVSPSLSSPSMHNNVRLRSAGIHAVTSSSVSVSIFLWQQLHFTGSLQAKTDCSEAMMTLFSQWKWQYFFSFSKGLWWNFPLSDVNFLTHRK